MFRLLIFFTLLIFSQTAFACFPAKISLQQRVEQASHISVGFVTGKTMTEFESRIDNPQQAIQTSEAYTLRIKITDEIKNHFDKKVIQAQIANCGSGGGDLKQKVMVFFDGQYWFVEKFDQEKLNNVKKIIDN